MKTIWVMGIMSLLWSSNSWAASSFCVNSCVNKGYDLNGCVAYCDQQQGLFEALPTPQQPTRTAPRIDFTCLSDCQYKLRYSYSYCQQACEY